MHTTSIGFLKVDFPFLRYSICFGGLQTSGKLSSHVIREQLGIAFIVLRGYEGSVKDSSVVSIDYPFVYGALYGFKCGNCGSKIGAVQSNLW